MGLGVGVGGWGLGLVIEQKCTKGWDNEDFGTRESHGESVGVGKYPGARINVPPAY